MSKPSGDSRKPGALMLAPEVPYPLAGGGAMRTASLLTWLSRRYHVDLIVFREPGSPDPRAAVPPELVSAIHVVELPFHSKEPWSRAARNLKRFVRGAPPLVDRFSRFDDQIGAHLSERRYALGVIEHFWCARYGGLLRQVCDRVVLDLHNIESVLLDRSAATHPWPTRAALSRFAASCRALEKKLLPQFDLLLITSEADRVHTVQAAPHVPAVVYRNAIPFAPRPSLPKIEEIVFSGNLDYDPNLAAVRFFQSDVWPALREKWPGLVWRIAGRNHERLAERMRGEAGVRFTGPFTDAITELASARAAVAPILSGSGTRIKIIEAWASGLPVISTSIGAEGLPGVPGEDLLIADTAVNFVRAVSSVLEFPSLAAKLGEHGRKLYESELTWDVAWRSLEPVL